MRLERHVGGLSLARKRHYLGLRGWNEGAAGWSNGVAEAEPVPLGRALHHQLTVDLARALAPSGWKIGGYSSRGYARMEDPLGEPCSLPAALRRQARREKRAVGEFTYSLFLAALL